MDLPLSSRTLGNYKEVKVTNTEEDESTDHYKDLSDTDVNSDSDVEFPLPSNSVLKKHNGNCVGIHGESSDTNVNCNVKSKPWKYDYIKNNKILCEGNLKNSEDEDECVIDLENCGSLRERILSTGTNSKQKTLKNNSSISTSKVHVLSDSYRDVKMNENATVCLDTHNTVPSNNNFCDRTSPLTISDNSNDGYHNTQDCDSDICVIEKESLSALVKKRTSDVLISNGQNLCGSSYTSEFCGTLSSANSVISNNSDNTDEMIPSKKYKRSKDEIEEKKRKAQELRLEKEKEKLEKKLAREEKLAQKEKEKQIKNTERERKKQLGLNSFMYLKVVLDPHIVNECGLGAAIFNVCEKLGVSCHTEEQKIPYTICWRRTLTECSVIGNQVETINKEVTEDEIISVLPLSDFVEMVHTSKQKKVGNYCEGKTLREYVQTVQKYLTGKIFTMVVMGMEKYFRDQKTMANRHHREAVMANGPTLESNKGRKSKKNQLSSIVSRVDVEEAVTDTQLQTDSMVYMMETGEEIAEFIRTYTKAVAEKPAKKDRLTSIFSFHEEGTTGVKVDKSGHGLLKVWKQQLMQFKNISPDVAEALISVYPSPWLLMQDYKKCNSEKEAIRLLENIVVRRGAGVLETTRRVGKELSRRIYTAMTCSDPAFVIK